VVERKGSKEAAGVRCGDESVFVATVRGVAWGCMPPT
jgi:hypothetical protein